VHGDEPPLLCCHHVEPIVKQLQYYNGVLGYGPAGQTLLDLATVDCANSIVLLDDRLKLEPPFLHLESSLFCMAAPYN
jgi:hypothetical protein